MGEGVHTCVTTQYFDQYLSGGILQMHRITFTSCKGIVFNIGILEL